MKQTLRCTCLAVAVAALAAIAPAAQADVTVIVNAANTANAASLDDDTIAALFLGQTRAFPGGAEAVPVNQRDTSPVSQEFASKYLKKTPAQLRAYWAKQVFTGGGKAPKDLENDEAVIKFVAATPGAIGYIEGKPGPGVKAVRK